MTTCTRCGKKQKSMWGYSWASMTSSYSFYLCNRCRVWALNTILICEESVVGQRLHNAIINTLKWTKKDEEET